MTCRMPRETPFPSRGDDQRPRPGLATEDRYTLRLLGLEDPELKDCRLVTEPVPSDGGGLRVIFDPQKGVPAGKSLAGRTLRSWPDSGSKAID